MAKLSALDTFKAILDIAGVKYHESYFQGGWTRCVGGYVDHDCETGWHAFFDRWGARFTSGEGFTWTS